MRSSISAIDLWSAMRQLIAMVYGKSYMTWEQQQIYRSASQLVVNYADQEGLNLDDVGVRPPEARTYLEGLEEWEAAHETTSPGEPWEPSWQDEYLACCPVSSDPVSQLAEGVPLEVYRGEIPEPADGF